MKTVTEFAAITLKNAAKTKADLVAAGKTPEELPAAMGEALKLEGDKLTFILNALETVGEKTNDLKRVLVLSLNEGEKAPGRAEKKGDHYYVIEYYPSLNPPRGRGAPGQDRGRGDRSGRGGKRGDKKRGGGRRGDRNEKREGAPGEGGGSPDRRPRGPRRDQRGPGKQQARPEGQKSAPAAAPKTEAPKEST